MEKEFFEDLQDILKTWLAEKNMTTENFIDLDFLLEKELFGQFLRHFIPKIEKLANLKELRLSTVISGELRICSETILFKSGSKLYYKKPFLAYLRNKWLFFHSLWLLFYKNSTKQKTFLAANDLVAAQNLVVKEAFD